MEQKKILSIDELLEINEVMLGRGRPIQDDGIGYNKADYGVCSNYFYGLSSAQIYDLARRLIKYSETQLNIKKQVMKDTAEYYKLFVDEGSNRETGVSVYVVGEETVISFKYNQDFINVVKSRPKRRFDVESKQWIVPSNDALNTLIALKEVGADVDNAIEYVKNHPQCKPEINKVDILVKFENELAFLKFNYNQKIVNKIKEIDFKDRKWNNQYKFWAIKKKHFNALKDSLSDFANFKVM